jgi:hypothetical protein
MRGLPSCAGRWLFDSKDEFNEMKMNLIERYYLLDGAEILLAMCKVTANSLLAIKP